MHVCIVDRVRKMLTLAGLAVLSVAAGLVFVLVTWLIVYLGGR